MARKHEYPKGEIVWLRCDDGSRPGVVKNVTVVYEVTWPDASCTYHELHEITNVRDDLVQEWTGASREGE